MIRLTLFFAIIILSLHHGINGITVINGSAEPVINNESEKLGANIENDRVKDVKNVKAVPDKLNSGIIQKADAENAKTNDAKDMKSKNGVLMNYETGDSSEFTVINGVDEGKSTDQKQVDGSSVAKSVPVDDKIVKNSPNDNDTLYNKALKIANEIQTEVQHHNEGNSPLISGTDGIEGSADGDVQKLGGPKANSEIKNSNGITKLMQLKEILNAMLHELSGKDEPTISRNLGAKPSGNDVQMEPKAKVAKNSVGEEGEGQKISQNVTIGTKAPDVTVLSPINKRDVKVGQNENGKEAKSNTIFKNMADKISRIGTKITGMLKLGLLPVKNISNQAKSLNVVGGAQNKVKSGTGLAGKVVKGPLVPKAQESVSNAGVSQVNNSGVDKPSQPGLGQAPIENSNDPTVVHKVGNGVAPNANNQNKAEASLVQESQTNANQSVGNVNLGNDTEPESIEKTKIVRPIGGAVSPVANGEKTKEMAVGPQGVKDGIKTPTVNQPEASIQSVGAKNVPDENKQMQKVPALGGGNPKLFLVWKKRRLMSHVEDFERENDEAEEYVRYPKTNKESKKASVKRFKPKIRQDQMEIEDEGFQNEEGLGPKERVRAKNHVAEKVDGDFQSGEEQDLEDHDGHFVHKKVLPVKEPSEQNLDFSGDDDVQNRYQPNVDTTPPKKMEERRTKNDGTFFPDNANDWNDMSKYGDSSHLSQDDVQDRYQPNIDTRPQRNMEERRTKKDGTFFPDNANDWNDMSKYGDSSHLSPEDDLENDLNGDLYGNPMMDSRPPFDRRVAYHNSFDANRGGSKDQAGQMDNKLQEQEQQQQQQHLKEQKMRRTAKIVHKRLKSDDHKTFDYHIDADQINDPKFKLAKVVNALSNGFKDQLHKPETEISDINVDRWTGTNDVSGVPSMAFSLIVNIFTIFILTLIA